MAHSVVGCCQPSAGWEQMFVVGWFVFVLFEDFFKDFIICVQWIHFVVDHGEPLFSFGEVLQHVVII